MTGEPWPPPPSEAGGTWPPPPSGADGILPPPPPPPPSPSGAGGGTSPPPLGATVAHFQQLYYTSCEHGLSGFSGFQFNAVSPSVSAETRHAVEALAGYEPPRSMVESDTPELLERCPVNLCYRPYDPQGRTATALSVRYAGRDSARRFGNYFAHALHSEDFPAAGGGVLGIELWDSPVWARAASPTTEIPALTAAPPRGPLGVGAARDFVRDHPHADRLPELLAAVFAALTDHGSVVVVDDSTDRIAHWFAAVSYLLPPPLARRLSFATYVFRPARSRLHLIGTVPEAQLDFSTDEEAAYTVFDFCRGRFPHPGIAVPHLVPLLTRIGLGSVRPVWYWTADYTRGLEETPDDWHAPVAAAAASGGIALTGPDVRAVIGWLAGADHLGPRRATVAADLLRKHRDLDERQLTALSTAAKAGGDLAVHQEIEGKLHESRMRAHMTGAEGATAPGPIADRDERERATLLWEHLLRTEATTTRQRVRLFLWALGARLAPSRELVARETLALARVLLGSASPGPGLRREVVELVGALPPMREALAMGVQEALEGRGGQEQLFAQFPAELLGEQDLWGRPLLLEYHWRARAEREPARTVDIMFAILELRGRGSPDAELLRGLWHPARAWTHEEAVRIARELSGAGHVDEAVGEWLDRAVNQRIDDENGLSACLELCEVLSAPARFAWLPRAAQDRVRTILELDSALREKREATELVSGFRIAGAAPWSAPQALKRFRLVPAMLALPVDVGRLGAEFPEFGHALAEQYLLAVRRVVTTGERYDDLLLGHVAAVSALPTPGRLPEAQQDLVHEIRGHAADHWRTTDLNRLERAVRPHNPLLADYYGRRAEARLSGTQKLARKVRLPRRRGKGGPPEEQNGR
ncbi:GTPase-associated protein 1-related protein [Streptomyces tsukubensis]|uniref:GTPase-associated protein 1-related protein n=1 Tax=Streptomyces tsukubensis TaxID=83656 RepID=UPI001D04FE5F|nr:GTPase-associated protein 1-related protein [Streptomyces tsukubensis]